MLNTHTKRREKKTKCKPSVIFAVFSRQNSFGKMVFQLVGRYPFIIDNEDRNNVPGSSFSFFFVDRDFLTG